MVQHLIPNQPDKQTTIEEEALSSREYEIVKLVAEGYRSKEIGEKLFISSRTVEAHKNNIMAKLKLKSTIDIVKYAIKNNIIEL